MKLKLPKIKKVSLRMTLYFTVLVVLVILIVNFFTCLIFTNELVRQTNYVVQRKMHTIVRDIHTKIAEVRTLCSNIQEDSEIVEILASGRDYIKFDELTMRERKIPYLLRKYTSECEWVDKIILIDHKENILDLDYSNSGFREKMLNDADFLDFANSCYFENFSLSKVFPIVRNGYISNSEHYITYYNKFLDTRYNRLGYLVVNLNTNNLFNETEIFCREIFDSAYILNSRGEFIYSIDSLGIGREILSMGIMGGNYEKGKLRTLKGEKYLVFNKPLSYNTDWTIVGIISYEGLTKNVKVMSITIYLIGMLCIIAVIVVSSYIAKSITNPIIKVNKAISRLDTGKWPEPIAIRSEDELRHLVDGINRMVKNLKLLFKRIRDEEENKKRAEIKALQFQLDLLQSQINPHFIYNTLNTISYFALKNGDESLRELIQSFNMLLRSSISVGNDFVTIAKELDLLRKYLKIQEYRYGKIFNMVFAVPGDLLQFKIPKLILQPIVENSIFHGIAPKGSKGTIKVEFQKEEKLIRIKVIDDGVGISKDNIKNILRGKRGKYKKGFNNIGLANITERLKLYFGDEYGLKIYSNLGIGTTAEFCIPFIDH